MRRAEKVVTTVDALIAATKDEGIEMIILDTELYDVPPITLASGQSLRGEGERTHLNFMAGIDGLRLSADNSVFDIHVSASPEKRAIYNDVGVMHLGDIELRNITATGRVQILARDQVRAGHVEGSGLDIVSADARGQSERAHEYGVYVLQGAFTLWNMQPDDSVTITANLVGISAGRLGKPVLGGGIFVGGASDTGGGLRVQNLETAAVYSNGMIAPGTSNQISGGVFTVYGAHVDVVHNRGPVMTFGVNDMALDNWGSVDRWMADGKITTHGASGIGFVNFGTLRELRLESPIETFGTGARGFNVYAGTVGVADFDRIVTHGDGAVGVQIAQPMGRLLVRRGIETFGGVGASLVKGVLQNLSAIALSIKPGGSVRSVQIFGGLKTHAAGIPPIEQYGSIESFTVVDGFAPLGGGF